MGTSYDAESSKLLKKIKHYKKTTRRDGVVFFISVIIYKGLRQYLFLLYCWMDRCPKTNQSVCWSDYR